VNWRVVAPAAVLVVSLGALGAGLVAAMMSRPRPDPSGALAEARALVERQEFESALRVLNEDALPIIRAGYSTLEQQRELLRLRARSLFMGQEVRGQDIEANHRAVVENYHRAEELGAELEPVEVYQLARSHVSLGEVGPAVQRARSLPAGEGELRRRIFRLIVERELSGAGEVKGRGRGLELLAELLTDPGLSDQERAWAVARRAELQLRAGHAAEAVARLLRELQQLRQISPAQQAELRVLLARAYLAVEDDAGAAAHLSEAGALLDPTDDLRGEVEELLGRIDERAGRLGEGKEGGQPGAREHYQNVVQQFPQSAGALPARVGLGRVLAALGEHEAALESFEHAVEDLRRHGARHGVTVESVTAGLMGVHADRFGAGTPGSTRIALRYAELAAMLHPEGRTPPDVLLALARTHRRLAEEILAEARAGKEGARWMDEVSAVTREEVKLRLLDAGRFFREHARSVREGDAAVYAASLWEAADSYDLAGDAEAAAAAFGEYIDGATDTDPRRPEARFRLAQVLQSQREYASAAALYEGLIEGRGNGTAGPWGDRSLVPLAQCLLRDADAANDQKAEQWLRTAVDGRTLSPEAMEYRDGLVELGRLLYETGRYAEAIERLSDAVARYPDDPEAHSLRYRLAESYRLSAAAIAKDLETIALTQDERAEWTRAREERLALAMEHYLAARRGLEAKDPSRLSELERVQLRNSYFYLGDVAFDRGDYARAIEYYDAARQRYETDPASLVAMVQIVNAYVEQGDWAKAATANARARRHLEAMPASVWDDPSLPMERRHWEAWLRSSTLLERRAAGGE